MSYDATNTYATVDDVKQRTTDNGYVNLADRDGDGSVSSDELNDVQESIEAANQIVDAALQKHINPDDARASGNVWLRDRCVDIAVYNIATIGGRTAPEAWEVIRDDAIKYLRQVSTGQLSVPRLDYPTPQKANKMTRGVPRAINIR